MSTTASVPEIRPVDSLGFKLASAVSGSFVFLALLGFGTVEIADAPLDTAEARSLAVFCLLAYAYLQLSCASHQRHSLRTLRTRIYFWLLVLLPVWSLPTAWVLVRAIQWTIRGIARV